MSVALFFQALSGGSPGLIDVHSILDDQNARFSAGYYGAVAYDKQSKHSGLPK